MPDDQSVKPTPVPETPAATPPTSNTPAATNGLAIAAMVVGIVAFISGWLPFWGLLVGVAAIVLGFIALKKPTGKGMAITGIITGALAVLTSIIFTVLFVVTLVAGTAFVNEAKNQVDQETAQSQEKIDAKKDFAKGEVAQFGTFEVTVNSVQRNFVPESEFYQPEEGKEFVVVNVTIKNTGSEAEYISPYDLSINDAGMAVTNAFVQIDSELESGDLSPDASATGNIVYEVTKDSTDLKLQYEEIVFTPTYESKELTYTLAI